MLKMLEMSQENRVSNANILDYIKHLTAGTLYCSGQIVLNDRFLSHANK